MNGQIQGLFITHPREKAQIKMQEELLRPQIAGEHQVQEVSNKVKFELANNK